MVVRQFILAFVVFCFAIAPNMAFAMASPNTNWSQWGGKDIGLLDESGTSTTEAKVTDKIHNASSNLKQSHAAGFARVTNYGRIAITRNNHLKVSSPSATTWGRSGPFVGGYSMGDWVKSGATLEATGNSVTINNATVTNLAAYGGVSLTTQSQSGSIGNKATADYNKVIIKDSEIWMEDSGDGMGGVLGCRRLRWF